MSTISIVMMILFMAIIWGGLVFAIISLVTAKRTPADLYLEAHPELDR